MGRWARKPVNHTSWVAVVTPTDRPKSVRNRCLIELFCGVVCVVTLPFWHFCWCRGFCHRTESDLFLFLIIRILSVYRRNLYTKYEFPKKGYAIDPPLSMWGKVCKITCQQRMNNSLFEIPVRRHPDRGTWTSFTSWKPYIQSYRFFCIRGFGQP